MKKGICVILSLVLLLGISGCGVEPATPEQTSAPEEKELAFSLSSLPEIGDFVSDEKAEYFFSDGAQHTFTPRQDYGKILPYFADVTYYRSPKKQTYVDENGETVEYISDFDYSEYYYRYGLMTRDGKIITDGIWTGFFISEFGDGRGYLTMNETNRISYESNGGADVIALDGTWRLHFDNFKGTMNLSPFGLPYFLATGDKKSAVYTLEGEAVLDLGDYLYYYSDDYYIAPEIIFANEDLLLLRGQAMANWDKDKAFNNPYSAGIYTAMDWDGNILYMLQFDNAELSYLCGEILMLSDNSGDFFKLVTLSGEPIHGYRYTFVTYDAKEGMILAKGKLGTENIEYYDTEGNPVQPEEVRWNTYSRKFVGSNWLYTGENGSFIFNNGDKRAFDLFGRPLQFPVREEEIRLLKIIDDYQNHRSSFYVYSKTGESFLCDADGSLLLQIATPKNAEAASGSGSPPDLGLFVRGDYACCVTEDGTVCVYDLATGEERTMFLGEKNLLPNTSYDPVFISRDYLELYIYDYDTDYFQTLLFSIPEQRLLYRDVLNLTFVDGCVLVAERAHSLVYGPNGELLLRLKNDGIV